MNAKKKKTIQEVVEDATKTVAEVADDVVTAAEPTVTAVVKEVTEKAAPVVSKAKTAGKAAVSALIPEMYIQMGGKEYDCTVLADRCKASYRETHKNPICSVKIYVKPEDSAAYYVINGEDGKIEL